MGLLWAAVIMGIVEGLTEFIPVSSTGHLIVAGQLLGLEGERAKTFEIVIQLGAILAVVVTYRHRFLKLLDFRGKTGDAFAGIRGCLILGVTTAPILVAGFLLHDFLKAHLFGPVPVAWALEIGGIGILLVEQWHPSATTEGLDRIGWAQALGVGLFQCLA